MRKTWWCTAWATAALLGCTSAREEQARAQRDRARLAARNLERAEQTERALARAEAHPQAPAQSLDRRRPAPLPARHAGGTLSKVTRRLSKLEDRADQLRTRTEDASPPARARLHDEWNRYSAQHDAAVDRVRRVEEAPEAELATYETEADKHLDALEVSLGRIASKLK